MAALQSHIFILLTIVMTVYGQLIVKWRVVGAGAIPVENWERVIFFLKLMTQPWIISVYIATLIAGISWMAAMTRLELNYAYPFMSATFILVMILSNIFFHESITNAKVIGMGLIVAGLVIGSQG